MKRAIFDIEPAKRVNCPQCGYLLPVYFQYTKLLECPSCHSTIFLEDDGAKLKGRASTLSPEPSLIELHHKFSYRGESFTPLGKIRYSYGRGFWDEWFLRRDDGEPWWLSVDEGDFVLERPVDISILGDFTTDNIAIGHFIGDYMVSEMAEAKCEGFAGELPEPIEVGDRHFYIHLSGANGELLTLESSERFGERLFRGHWIDAFEIEVEA